MQDNNSNFLMAVVLSLGVLLGWQFFVVEPRLAEERASQLAAAEEIAAFGENQGTGASPESELRAPDISGAPTVAGTAPAPSTKPANNDAFADSPRLKIETEQLSGSIALMGARFDDLILADYAESLAADARASAFCKPKTNSGTGRCIMAGSGERVPMSPCPGRPACGAWWTARC